MKIKAIAPYFTHDSNARNSSKLISVRMKYGAEGYGIYFMIIERLREEDDYSSLADYERLAFDLRVESVKIKSIVEDFDLFKFTEDGKRFYSISLNKRMEFKDKKLNQLSEKGRRAAAKRWNNENDNEKQKDEDESDEERHFNEIESDNNFKKNYRNLKKDFDDIDKSSSFDEKNDENKIRDDLNTTKLAINSNEESKINAYASEKNACASKNNACASEKNACASEKNACASKNDAKYSIVKNSKVKNSIEKQTKSAINTFDFHPKVLEYTSNPELRDCLCVFFDERAKSKSVDESVVDMFFKQLDSYSAGDEDKKILILRNSNLNGWKNIYPVNLNDKKSTSKLDEYYMTDSRQTDGYSEAELKDIFNLKSHL
ncbi:Lin1244/Lin1753 domain-containing protein [Ezakiella coagulans]|uniref:Lin1244/Lin1753 domain-containing protein n=1 Tax=Ezakiella coagulans TaxID=46507 RepID=UPI002014C2E1|nr:Lin1244/Lin1753 domain-containing protein [Ezakiella coagulans]UQK60707.1 DUF4373 domain-containing protein [Ezakiella coagulans]